MRAPLLPDDATQLGRYALVGRLGEGGMGTVYLAQDPGGRAVAIKVVRAEYARDDRFRRRFRSEVNRARQVPPFCTAEVLDADPDHDPPYLVVEYIDGPNLTDVVHQHGPLSLANLHSTAVGIATALTAIHGAGVIHRDLKPGNVLFTLGGIKVIDFGIARALEATSHHTRTDHMVGTIAYMAPERFEPEGSARLSPAADIFSWGAVVAYAGTGRTPFGADSAPGTAVRILTQPPDVTGLPEPLRDLVVNALEKEPHNRPTARELLDRLLAAAPSPQPASRGEVPFLREVVKEAKRRGPAPVSQERRNVVRAAPFLQEVVQQAERRGPAGANPVPVPREASSPAVDRRHTARAPVQRLVGARGSTRRRWLTQAGVAATVLGILLAGGLAYRALGIGEDDSGGDTGVLQAPTFSPAGPQDPDGTQAILDGSRLTLLHLREISRNLTLPSKRGGAVAAERNDGTPFALVPDQGGSYLLRSDTPGSCLAVLPGRPGPKSKLTASVCVANDETLFNLTDSGRPDPQGQTTFYLQNQRYGTVQWSSDRSEMYVEPVPAELIDTTFLLVDQGPA
jgi:eukaryotic-like serine/threonine-protein kinase